MKKLFVSCLLGVVLFSISAFNGAPPALGVPLTPDGSNIVTTKEDLPFKRWIPWRDTRGPRVPYQYPMDFLRQTGKLIPVIKPTFEWLMWFIWLPCDDYFERLEEFAVGFGGTPYARAEHLRQIMPGYYFFGCYDCSWVGLDLHVCEIGVDSWNDTWPEGYVYTDLQNYPQ